MTREEDRALRMDACAGLRALGRLKQQGCPFGENVSVHAGLLDAIAKPLETFLSRCSPPAAPVKRDGNGRFAK